MTIGKRLKVEREKLGFNQTDFAAIGGVGRKSQFNYEDDERRPDAAYLAAIAAAGADIRYIVTGERDGPPPEVLSTDERYLLERYRASPAPLRDAALRVLLGGDPPKSRRGQTIIHGNVGPRMGDNHAPMTINMDNRKK